MSIFNTVYPNGIDLRAREGFFDDLYQKNHLTGNFERVNGGGGGDVDLPEYLYSDYIQFRGSEEILNGPRLDAIKASENELKNLTEVVLPAHELSLEQLDTTTKQLSTRIANVQTEGFQNRDNLAALTVRTTAVETKATDNATSITGHGTRLTAVETKATNNATNITTHGTRLTNVEAKATTNANDIVSHGTRLTTVEGKATAIEGDITTNVKPKLVTNPLKIETGSKLIQLNSTSTKPEVQVKNGNYSTFIHQDAISMTDPNGTVSIGRNEFTHLNEIRTAPTAPTGLTLQYLGYGRGPDNLYRYYKVNSAGNARKAVQAYVVQSNNTNGFSWAEVTPTTTGALQWIRKDMQINSLRVYNINGVDDLFLSFSPHALVVPATPSTAGFTSYFFAFLCEGLDVENTYVDARLHLSRRSDDREKWVTFSDYGAFTGDVRFNSFTHPAVIIRMTVPNSAPEGSFGGTIHFAFHRKLTMTDAQVTVTHATS